MKIEVTTALRNYITSRIAKTFARCWLIITTRGDKFGFTSHTRNLTFGGVVYLSTAGFQMSDLRSSEGLAPDTTDIATFLTTTNEALVVAGVFDNAYLEIFTVNYHDLTMKQITEKSGYFGEISRSDGILSIELRGLTQVLDTKIGEVFSGSCQANLGDDRCKVEIYPVVHEVLCDLSGDTITRIDDGSFIEDGYFIDRTLKISGTLLGNNFTAVIDGVFIGVINLVGVTFTTETSVKVILTQSSPFYATGEVSTILIPKRSFELDISADNRFYNQGTMKFITGNNEGFKRDIRSQIENEFVLYLPFPYEVEVGDELEVTAGCNKQGITCEEKYGNKINFRGFDHTPVQEDVFYSPFTNSISTDPKV